MSTGHSLSATVMAGTAEYDAGAGATAEKWSALHRAAAAVARLARIDPRPDDAEWDRLPLAVSAATGWRKVLADQGIDDLAAIMEPGIAALLALHSRGLPGPAAAQALWQEFLLARTALIALASPPGSGPSCPS